MGTQPNPTQPSPSLHPPNAPSNPNPNPSMPKINDSRFIKKTKNRASDDSASSSSSFIPPQDRIFNHNKRGIRISSKLRNPRFSVRRSASDVEAIAFPLGMSIAAVLAQVLERKDLAHEKTSVDQLSMICTSAVRESLSNVFGDKFDAFTRNFEKSFGSTLSTLPLIKHSSIDYGEDQLVHYHFDDHFTDSTPTIFLNKRECEHLGKVEEFGDNQELSLQRHMSQQLSTGSNLQSYSGNNSMLSTIEKSVMEQSRANDLKSVEIGLIMRKLQLKETQLALNSDLNILERCILSLGISRTSFKADKFCLRSPNPGGSQGPYHPSIQGCSP